MSGADTNSLFAHGKSEGIVSSRHLAHLKRLESESVRILRELAASFERPVLMY